MNRYQIARNSGSSSFGKQLLDDSLRLVVFPFAENMMPDAPLCVDKVEGRPVFIAKGAPNRVIAIDYHRVIDASFFYCAANVLRVLLEREFWRVHANSYQPIGPVFRSPGADIWKLTSPVDAGIRPELDQGDLAPQAAGC